MRESRESKEGGERRDRDKTEAEAILVRGKRPGGRVRTYFYRNIGKKGMEGLVSG